MKHTRLFAGRRRAVLPSSMVGTASAQSRPPSAYKIGVSNTLPGQRLARGDDLLHEGPGARLAARSREIIVAHRNTDAAGQLEDLSNLITAGVNAIIVNPVSPDALNPAIKEATDAGIVVVAVDLAVTEPSAYIFSNDQEEYGYLGAKWLFEQLGGEGDVVYMRGVAGISADTDRDTGFKRALAEYPGINIASEVQTGWDIATGAQQINDFLDSGVPFDGIWTSGIDSTSSWTRSSTAGAPLVPVVGADNAGFVNQLGDRRGPRRRRGHQPGLRRRCRRGPGAQDPHRRDGRPAGPPDPRGVGQHHRRGQGPDRRGQ